MAVSNVYQLIWWKSRNGYCAVSYLISSSRIAATSSSLPSQSILDHSVGAQYQETISSELLMYLHSWDGLIVHIFIEL